MRPAKTRNSTREMKSSEKEESLMPVSRRYSKIISNLLQTPGGTRTMIRSVRLTRPFRFRKIKPCRARDALGRNQRLAAFELADGHQDVQNVRRLARAQLAP